jgi:hypothetical protein
LVSTGWLKEPKDQKKAAQNKPKRERAARARNLPSFRNGNEKKSVGNFSKMATAMTGTTRIEYFYFIFFLEVRC